MRRRKSRDLATVLLDIGAKVPWQVSVIAAVALFLTFYLTANIDAPTAAAPAAMGVLGSILRFIAILLQYVVPALLLIGVVVSAVIRKRARAPQPAVIHAGSGNAIRNLTWRQFEKFLSTHFAQLGFAVKKTGKPGADGGVNLKLHRGKDKYLVQCKHWRARQIEVAAVRELCGAIASVGAAGGIVVTAGSFSDQARKFADSRKVELIDGQMLEGLMRTSQRRPPRAARKSPAAPKCPSCGSPMLVRVARQGAKAGKAFWGCPRFPACRGTLPA